jgi:hypothetical protein
LRLVIEQPWTHGGSYVRDQNVCLADLVQKGLAPQVQHMLDTVRVIGGQAVHPLTMDLRDDHETGQTLCLLVNETVDEMITRPNSIKMAYENVPAS